MVISKQKNIVISYDNGGVITNSELYDSSKYICLSLNGDIKSTKGILSIINPGEYEYMGILIKVTQNKNTFISSEGIKICIVGDDSLLIKEDGINNVDIIILDAIKGKKYSQEDILAIQKAIQPKIIVANSHTADENIANAEKINKIKMKSSELDAIVDTKLYIL
ncbi:MAG: hypothetical protein WCJ19_00385 [bacterium]